jgi:multisubunit Na+/H+ antiporter MnhF subunit
MSAYGILALTLLIGGIAPAAAMGAIGHAQNRLVALELVASLAALFMLLFIQWNAQSFELILPLVLVTLSLTGTLVFTRLVRGADS